MPYQKKEMNYEQYTKREIISSEISFISYNLKREKRLIDENYYDKKTS